jgi:hypothetical protein
VAVFVPCRVRLRSLDAHRNAPLVCHPTFVAHSILPLCTEPSGEEKYRTESGQHHITLVISRPGLLVSRAGFQAQVGSFAMAPSCVERDDLCQSASQHDEGSKGMALLLSSLSSTGLCESQHDCTALELLSPHMVSRLMGPQFSSFPSSLCMFTLQTDFNVQSL